MQPGNKRSCDNCGNDVFLDAQFCSHCGHSLAASYRPTVRSSNASPTIIPSSIPQMPLPDTPGRRMTGALQAMDILQQRYRIMRLLGRGGFGAVYEAADLRIRGRRVAIKEMSYSQFDTSSMAQAVQDFEHEATILDGLGHAGCIKLRIAHLFNGNPSASYTKIGSLVDGPESSSTE